MLAVASITESTFARRPVRLLDVVYALFNNIAKDSVCLVNKAAHEARFTQVFSVSFSASRLQGLQPIAELGTNK